MGGDPLDLPVRVDLLEEPATLAINGGTPVRNRPFPAWPCFDKADEAAVLAALRSGRWGSRPSDGFGNEFATSLAKFQGARRAIATANGTVALEVALKAVGVMPLDEVIVPAYTFIATATAVLALGAIPIFADLDPETYTIDPQDAARRVTSHTRAIVPVHLAGQPADMDGIMAVARTHGLRVVEDAAQAIGASWRGKGVGTIGDIGTFSFQSSKNLNAGEGGAITTDDEALADMAWSLANCGRVPGGAWYHHDITGSNYRMTEIQASLLLSQLARLPGQFARREQSARVLDDGFRSIPGLAPQARPTAITGHAHHLYVLRYDPKGFGGRPRRWFIDAMRAEGIPCSPGYEVPLHRMPGVIAARRTWIDLALRTGRRVLVSDDPDEVGLRVTDRASREEGIWFSQSLLLGEDDDMVDVVEAARRIRAWCNYSGPSFPLPPQRGRD